MTSAAEYLASGRDIIAESRLQRALVSRIVMLVISRVYAVFVCCWSRRSSEVHFCQCLHNVHLIISVRFSFSGTHLLKCSDALPTKKEKDYTRTI